MEEDIMSWFNKENRLQNRAFKRFGIGLITFMLFASTPVSSKVYNTVPLTSTERAWKKTPLKYFSQKAKIYPNEFVKDYLGNPTLSLAETDTKIHDLNFPIVPFKPMGIDMNFDIVLSVSDDPYSMIELIRIDLENQKSIWFILDSKFNGQQFIGLPENVEDKEKVAQIASKLGLKTYDAYLEEPKISEGDELSMYSFSYTRRDPEGKSDAERMNFEVFVSHEINIDQENENAIVKPKLRARNSSAMNHSEASFLTAIDIYKATPFTKTNKLTIKDLNSPDGEAPFQKILDVEVKSLISQTVLGLGSGRTIISPEEPLKWTNETDEQVIYSQEQKIGDQSLQHIDYVFLKLNGKLQLQSIDIKQSTSSETIGTIHFNPALPDLRYELKSGIHRSRVAFTIRDIETREDYGFFLGEVHAQNDSVSGGHLLEVLPGNAELGHRKIFKTTPDWFYRRALVASIAKLPDATVQVDNYIMSPQPSNLSEGSYTPIKTETAKLIQAFDIKWDVRAHRLSRLVVKSDLAADDELRQYRPDNQNLSYGLAYMEGGSWGSGEKAQDLAMGSVCQKELSGTPTGTNFFHVSSQSFPMRLSNLEFPYRKNFYNSQEAKVIGIHKMNIEFEEEIDLSKIALALNGFKIVAGPNHKQIGITTNGLEFSLVMKDDSLADGTQIYSPRVSATNPNILEVYVQAIHQFGPEFSRPTSGPARQNLSSYSALANIDLLIIQAESEIEQKQTTEEFTNLTDFHIAKPDQLKMIASNKTICLNTEGKSDLTQEPILLLTKMKYMSAKSRDVSIDDKEELEKQRVSRYTRQISMNIGDPNQPKKHDMTVTNTGELSWATRFVYELGVSTLAPLPPAEETPEEVE